MAPPLQALIIEDDPIMRDLISIALEGAGYCTSVASDERTASEALHHLRPDLIVSDYDLGEGMSGIELARLLRQRLPKHRSILFSSHHFASSEVEGMEYIFKGDGGLLNLLLAVQH